MNKKDILFVFYTIIGVTAVLYCGAMINFLPFIADDLIVSEIEFCTLIICAVVAICSCRKK